MGVVHKIMGFFGLHDEGEQQFDPLEEEETPVSSKNKVVSLQQMKMKAKLVLIEPHSYEDAQDIADELRNRRAVIVNLQRVEEKQARRIIDFLSGTVYALNGEIQRLSADTFLCTPENIEIQGTITNTATDETTITRLR